MSELWKAALAEVQRKFRGAANHWRNLRHRVYIATSFHPSVADSYHGGDGGFDYFFKYSAEPERWWLCRMDGMLDQDAEGGRLFLGLAKEAGQVCATADVGLDWFPDPGRWDFRNQNGPDDYWAVILHHIAWKRLPGVPLQSHTDQVTSSAYHAVDSEDVDGYQHGLRSVLTIDPFSASTYAVGTLIAEEKRRKPRAKRRGRKQQYDATADERVADDWKASGMRTYHDFELARGWPSGTVKRALDRIRSRDRRAK